jgi:hypothetical protein
MDAMSVDLTGSATGTPDLVRLDQKTSSSIQSFIKDSLSLDLLGLLPSTTQNHQQNRKDVLDEAFRDSISFSLREISRVLNQSSPLVKSTRRKSSIPSTVQSVCDLLQQLDLVVNRINDKLIHAQFIVESSNNFVQQQQKKILNEENKMPKSSSTTNQQHQIEIQNLKFENEQMNKQLARMKEREEVLLRRVRDLEIDCRVKAHIVSETIASAQAIFDENSILRQIAEHNSSLLLEVDALSRCVAENDTLHSELAAKQKLIDSMEEKTEKLKAEIRHLRKV